MSKYQKLLLTEVPTLFRLLVFNLMSFCFRNSFRSPHCIECSCLLRLLWPGVLSQTCFLFVDWWFWVVLVMCFVQCSSVWVWLIYFSSCLEWSSGVRWGRWHRWFLIPHIQGTVILWLIKMHIFGHSDGQRISVFLIFGLPWFLAGVPKSLEFPKWWELWRSLLLLMRWHGDLT